MILVLLACHTGGTPPEEHDCVPLEQEGPAGNAPSGYEYCAVDPTNGFVHRVTAVDVAIDPYGDPDNACDPEGMPADCKTNSDCGERGVCGTGIWGGCECFDKCRTDDDCGTGAACIPELVSLVKNAGGLGGDNQCVPADCITDADCASGWCVLHKNACGWTGGLQCFGPEDECRTASDCSDGKECYSTGYAFICDYYWSCS